MASVPMMMARPHPHYDGCRRSRLGGRDGRQRPSAKQNCQTRCNKYFHVIPLDESCFLSDSAGIGQAFLPYDEKLREPRLDGREQP